MGSFGRIGWPGCLQIRELFRVAESEPEIHFEGERIIRICGGTESIANGIIFRCWHRLLAIIKTNSHLSLAKRSGNANSHVPMAIENLGNIVAQRACPLFLDGPAKLSEGLSLPDGLSALAGRAAWIKRGLKFARNYFQCLDRLENVPVRQRGEASSPIQQGDQSFIYLIC